ncbi:MAG: hypothetical protein ABI967_16250 [bacterium]
MVGLIEILIYMLAVYLVFKGVEIFQIALMSNRPDRTLGLLVGTGSIVVAIVVGGGFCYWAYAIASSLNERMNAIPNILR